MKSNQIMKIIPVSEPYISPKVQEYVSNAIDEKELSGNFGSYIAKFETNFAKFSGVKYAVCVSSGTTALHAALSVLDLAKGDEVIVQTLTNMATAFAVSYTGAIPIAADIESDTLNIDPAVIQSKITEKTKAIIVVHLFGHPVDMDPIIKIAKDNNLYIIEDCAQAHGSTYKGKKVGSLGDISCYSFYANKILATGEGGMVVTNNFDLAIKARKICSLSYGPSENRFMHEKIGFNYRMTNITAAIGCAQLEKIEEVIEKKRMIAKLYSDRLNGINELQLPIEKDYAFNVFWMYHVVLKGSAKGKRKNILKSLKEKGIDTRTSFVPLNQQNIYKNMGVVSFDSCPNANYVGENGFYIPSGPVIELKDLEYVADSLKAVLSAI
jgi:perosamine synthetase